MFNQQQLYAPIGESLEQAKRLAENYADETIRVDHMHFQDMEHLETDKSILTLRTTAQKQICERLQIPFSYMEKCEPTLQAININMRMDKVPPDKELLLRKDLNYVRAIFTTRYQPINNVDVLQQLVHHFGENTPVQTFLSDNVLNISVPNSQREFSLVSNDNFQPGVSVTNSETGSHAFSIEAFLLRLVCTNGLIVPVSVAMSKLRHVVQNFFSTFDFAKQIARVQDAGQDNNTKLRQALTIQVHTPDETKKKLVKLFQLSKAEHDAIDWGKDQEPGNTLYHYINAFTRGSQHPALNDDERYHLQYVGGMMTGLVKHPTQLIAAVE